MVVRDQTRLWAVSFGRTATWGRANRLFAVRVKQCTRRLALPSGGQDGSAGTTDGYLQLLDEGDLQVS